MRKKEDNHKTTEWAIAKVHGVSAVGVAMHFKLANRVTGRAHSLYFFGGGFTAGVEGKLPFLSDNLSYKSFRTRTPVNFENFRHVGARVSGITATAGVGYSKSYLTIWPGPAHKTKPLAKISMGGLALGKWGVSGQAATYGYMSIEYGDGEPNGLFPMVLEIQDPREPIELMPMVQVSAKERPLMSIPSDVLFEFDSSRIAHAAERSLIEAARVIELRDRGAVEIAGHTDSVGSREYNRELSLRRAEAVKRWLIKKRVHNANSFEITGYGEEKPVAPNKLPDGRDNPLGRKENRRVEIIFHY